MPNFLYFELKIDLSAKLSFGANNDHIMPFVTISLYASREDILQSQKQDQCTAECVQRRNIL